jgi:hypothetical protein
VSPRKSSQLEKAQLELAKGLTDDFAKQVVIREFKGGETKRMEMEVEVLLKSGYEIESQSGFGSHINVGRTVTPAILTGGLSLLFGASRTGRSIVLTFIRTSHGDALREIEVNKESIDLWQDAKASIKGVRDKMRELDAKQRYDERAGSVRRKWNPFVRLKYRNPTAHKFVILLLVGLVILGIVACESTLLSTVAGADLAGAAKPDGTLHE